MTPERIEELRQVWYKVSADVNSTYRERMAAFGAMAEAHKLYQRENGKGS